MSIVGDMWRDKNWMALWIGGTMGGPADYLSRPVTTFPTRATIDYNAPGGIDRYAVLSNLEIMGGALAGVDLAWAPPANGVANALRNKFDPWTYAYDVTVPPGTSSIDVVPTAMSTRIASMTIDGVPIASRKARTLPVADGTRITIVVTTPDRSTTGTYVLTVKVARRAP